MHEIYVYHVKVNDDDFDMSFTTPCQVCRRPYRVGLYADYVGTFKIKCECGAEFRIRQNKQGMTSVAHMFRVRPRVRLRLIKDGVEAPVSQICDEY